ncbi:transcription antitermination factor NusB [Aneurinibacillus uraniidurans]|uniref:transcription antitermination factor NusB n=1 Tax=Aneurinibacillus uraniidurans TaxID=2966586 RepID=UPI00234BA72F|nr:transcription antitermination factor NusB [Aneurinibacillus sp. B1]WCN38933.1 transcription antitermination factor NusB [Aneurinibacillus sp. B1]
MNRRQSREKAVQILFSMDMTDATAQEALVNLMEEDDEDVSEKAAENMEFLTELVEGTSAHQTEIDSKISQYLRGWTIGRIANVDRAILRLAGYEMMYREDIPVRVTLNEAVELAKVFGTDDSPKFINGVLSSMSRDLEQAEHKE